MAIRLDLTFLVLGSQESYVRDILSSAVAPLDRGGLGYRAVVVNFRGCMACSHISYFNSARVTDLKR